MKNQKSATFYILFAFILISVSSCGRSPEKGEVLVQIGDMKVTVSDFNERIANLPSRYQNVIKRRKKEFLQEFINDMILYQEAVRQGLNKDKEVLKVVDEARKKILIARLLKDSIDDTIEISNDEIATYYTDNKNNYMLPEVLRVSHILVPTREQAEEIVSELENGASFEETARAKSVDPTAQNGGDIGYFPRGQLIPEFERACVEIEIDEIAGPVKTKLGYHIVKLTDRKEPAQKPLIQVKEEIRSTLYTKKRREKFNRMIKDLTEKTKVEINEKALEGTGG